MISGFGILSEAQFQPEIFWSEGPLTKQEIELFKTGNGINLAFWSDGHFPVDVLC